MVSEDFGGVICEFEENPWTSIKRIINVQLLGFYKLN
jgi:hypothetical protein